MNLNYDPKSKRLRSSLLDGLKDEVFVDLTNDNRPYIVIGNFRTVEGIAIRFNIEYVCKGGCPKNDYLSNHLEDPPYDGNIMFDSPPPTHWIVDQEKVRAIRLRGVGD